MKHKHSRVAPGNKLTGNKIFSPDQPLGGLSREHKLIEVKIDTHKTPKYLT